MSTSDTILAALREAPMTRDQLALRLGVNAQSTGMALAHLRRLGNVAQGNDGKWRIADQPGPVSWEPALAAALAPAEPDPRELDGDDPPVDEDQPELVPAGADYAVWTDGSLTIARGDVAIALTRDEVVRMLAHLRRFGAC